MSRITREEVHAAAATLNGKGIKPTTIRVRETLGRGSYSTITKWLEEWEAPENMPEAEAPDVPEAVTALLPGLWATCYAEATAIIEGEIAVLQRELEEKAEELTSAQAAADSAEAEIEQITAELNKLKTENVTLRAEATQERAAREHAETQRDERDAHITSLRAAIETITGKKPLEKPATPKSGAGAGGGGGAGEKKTRSQPETDGARAKRGRGRGRPQSPTTAELEKLGQTRIDQ